jgi:hypothetical protein
MSMLHTATYINTMLSQTKILEIIQILLAVMHDRLLQLKTLFSRLYIVLEFFDPMSGFCVPVLW